jgi:hypothetical protein
MLMTIKEIEAACDASQRLDFSKHEMSIPELLLSKTFYPLGFPIEVRTNSTEVLELHEELWGMFEQRHHTEPIVTDIYVSDGGSVECPPAPEYRMMLPLITAVADGNNFSVVDINRNRTLTSLSCQTLRHKLYLGQCLLGMPWCCISTRYTTPIHAGCVSLNGHGVLLCGDAGAGKSTLSYACARAGWTYTSDDGCYVSHDRNDLQVEGTYYKVRFRPTAAELFPEVRGLEITPRVVGKPSIEMSTALMENIACAQTAHVNFIVFLNRNPGGPPALIPYRKDVARYSMRQMLYGSPETLAIQYKTVELLLALDVFELRYTDLDWAVERLRQLVRKGR